jgi:hypothetical protein
VSRSVCVHGLIAVCLVTLGACDRARSESDDRNAVGMNQLAERYVRLVLALGQHDADYVDAYYGPPDWKAAPGDELNRLRHEYLDRQVASLRTRVAMLSGQRLRFDQESKALYDAVAPTHTEAEFEDLLRQLDARLPGAGSVSQRLETFKKRFVIAPDRLEATFTAAITGCRQRTTKYIALPPAERFSVEYVTNKSWSGYNWYQGGYRSLIQVNTDLPIYVDRAVDLACHEGYPGHHVYNVLLEQHLVRDRGWVEFTVYPLFSPQSLIAEGTANYGIDVAFPATERRQFERQVIFPAAGLDPSRVDEYYDVFDLTARLAYAGNEAARRYLDGAIDAAAAAAWLETYALYAPARAAQRVKFIDQYRSYVINYNLGKDMVAHYIEAHGGTASAPGRRWALFAELISSPRLPSGLR